ncbi:glycoside hydrolase family 104 protein [Flavobacterium jejuense]|uniref:Glycoside hydrolase family 104 protein n=1 Tax=Flavobacterium jejuense TaxID=1544455 RepID=A0ABX0IXI3_9FLAO|nr:hypothetical protein [Flavobacterium jejuense]NHN28143.1 glycoside hydrolase family 104 protein [Flavobacterium jejuense]
MKLNAKAKVGEDGVLKVKIQWNKIPKIKTPRRVYAQVKDKDGKVLYDADGGSKSETDSSSKKSGYLGGAASLLFVAAAVYMVDNMATVVVGTQALSKNENENKVCECEAKIRAFMRVIRIAEGTGEYIKGTKQVRDSQLGYTTWFSGAGNNFTLSDDHPRVINSNSTNTLRSSAAGAYQIMSWKYDELNGYTIIFKDGYFQKKLPEEYNERNDKAKKYDAKGFSQVSQDRLCVIILKSIKNKKIRSNFIIFTY